MRGFTDLDDRVLESFEEQMCSLAEINGKKYSTTAKWWAENLEDDYSLYVKACRKEAK